MPDYDLRPLQPPYSWFRYAAFWASYTAMEPSATLAQRTLAWAVIVLIAAHVLGLAVIGILVIGAGFVAALPIGIAIMVVGALCFGLPFQVVRFYILHKRATGSFRSSKEELQVLADQNAALRNKEYQKSLHDKITGAIATAGVIGLWGAWVAWRRAHHHHDDWINPALFTLVAIYTISIQFRRPKSSNL